MRINDTIVGLTNSQLIRPYALSFVTLKTFKSNIFAIKLADGRIGVGEVTALPGYGEETFESIDKVLKQSMSMLNGCDYEEGIKYVKSISFQHPFAASCIGTALDLSFFCYNDRINHEIKIPLLCGIETKCSLSEIENQLRNADNAGFGTIKIKIGSDVRYDIKIVLYILELPFNFKIRFDANQGYSFEDAKKFVASFADFEYSKVELLEQPLRKELWKQTSELCAMTEIPVMLDESIYIRNDIKLAAQSGCKLIKLKLCKARGIEHLMDLARYAKSLGLKVVIGNGVATDIANYSEALAYVQEDGLFYGAIESNGFRRTMSTYLGKALSINQGHLVLPNNVPDFESFIKVL